MRHDEASEHLRQSSHEIAKLIGSPPGYLVHRETQALLYQEALNQQHTEKIELSLVLFDEIEKASADKSFELNVTDSARECLLTDGTDSRYGARHLKRAIERLIVYPLSNLIALGQIQRGDRIRVRHSEGSPTLMFFNQAPPAIASSQVAGRIAA